MGNSYHVDAIIMKEGYKILDAQESFDATKEETHPRKKKLSKTKITMMEAIKNDWLNARSDGSSLL